MKAFKHQLCHIKTVLNEKSKTEEEDYDESYSNNDFISNDYIALINVHIFFKGYSAFIKKGFDKYKPFSQQALIFCDALFNKMAICCKIGRFGEKRRRGGSKNNV